MASTQRQTRRSSARVDDEPDDEPPAKRHKADKPKARPPTKQTNPKKAGVGEQNNDRVYDQTQDDFTFTRKPPRKQSRRQTPEESRAQDEEIKPSNPKSRGRKRTSGSLERTASDAHGAAPTRRSKRLSGDSPAAQDRENVSSSDEVRRGREKERSSQSRLTKEAKTPQVDGDGGLRIERKRKDTKIALPFADTPVIQRNKEMRQTSSENRRRSSSMMRGRRASSLMDSKTSNAIPHNSVETREFYKHISQDLPEPRRMKQLLTWCGSRALTERPSGESGVKLNAMLAARTIQDELLEDFTNKSDMSDWFNRGEEVKPAVLVKKPNPRNQQNAIKLRELEAEVQRLEQELSRWDSLLSGLSSQLTAESSATKRDAPLRVEYLDTTDAEAAKVSTTAESSTTADARARLKAASTSLEFKLDSFAEGVHKLNMFDGVARESEDKIMEEAATALKRRGISESTRRGGGQETIGDILRAFGRTAR